jgi:hypothetical protein
VLGATIASCAPRAAHAQDQPTATPAPLGPVIPPELVTFAGDWPTPQGNLAGHRAAAATSIDAHNLDRLDVAWRFPIAASSGYGAVTATPIVAGETVFLQDMESNVFAIDLATGAPRWERRYDAPTASGNGVAIGYERVYAAIGLAAETFALDAATGEEIWRVKLSANPTEFIFMAPLVYDNVVYVGTSPGAYVGGSPGILAHRWPETDVLTRVTPHPLSFHRNIGLHGLAQPLPSAISVIFPIAFPSGGCHDTFRSDRRAATRRRLANSWIPLDPLPPGDHRFVHLLLPWPQTPARSPQRRPSSSRRGSSCSGRSRVSPRGTSRRCAVRRSPPTYQISGIPGDRISG